MLDHTTNPNVRKTPLDLLLRLVRAFGSKIFQKDDQFAADQGWQIVSRHGGLSRTYRDPRFNSLASCPVCDGLGNVPDSSICTRCGRSGRITLDETNTIPPGPGEQDRRWRP